MAKKKAFQFNSKANRSADKKKERKLNPFEIHINRVKHDVIGRKSKNDTGLPGISRAKAVKKRERTLLQEYKHSYKSNVFVDRRIGENNSRMDPEKKIALRIAAEKKRQFSKKSLFNLNDDEELTHRGLALDDANINDPINSDDEDDHMLDAKFVKEQHFGGGLFTKRGASEGDAQDDEKPKSRKEWIDEIIAESKKKKAESRKEKDEQYETVAKLDSELQNFMKLMANQKLTDEDKEKAKKSGEFRDYDSLVRELEFDRSGKARAVEKLKTPGELIKDERDRLLALEAERIRRMKGETTKEKTKSRSADDLDDGFVIPVDGDEKFHLSYRDGKILTAAQEERVEDSKSDSEGEDEEEEIKNMGEEEDEGGDEDEKGDGDEGDEEDEKDDESDKYSDILQDSESEEEDTGVQNDVESTRKNKVDPQKKEEMEAAKKEIPYTFEVPQDYDSFWSVLENHSPKEVDLIMERMITCNHTSLGATNKEKCDDIFAYLLQTLHVLTDVDGDSLIASISGMVYIETLVPHLYTLTQLSPSNSAKALLQVLDEKYADCNNTKFRRYPYANTFVFLKLAGILFPPSDFIHPVMTPVVTFLTHLLGQAKVTTRREVTAALFTAHILLEFLSSSKRFVPELMNLLNGLLYMAIPDKNKVHLPVNPPFKRSPPVGFLLVLENEVAEFTESKMTFKDLNRDKDDMDDEFKVNIIYKVLKSIKNLCSSWRELPSVHSILTPTYQLLRNFSLELYPICVKESVKELFASIEHLPAQGLALAKEERKPVSIAMLEPAIEKIIEGKRKRHGTKEYLEKQKLLHKVKRERKGARREIQQDNAFMARQKLAETLQSDSERAKKIRQIKSELQLQEGEIKMMKKKK